MECDSCDNTCTKKDTLRMHKGVKHKAKLSNCDKCDYSCTKNEVLVMHKFRKNGGQEPPMKLCELCDFTCLTTGGLRFHQNAEHLGLKGSQQFTSALCDYTFQKLHSVNTESESMVFFFFLNEKNIVIV